MPPATARAAAAYCHDPQRTICDGSRNAIALLAHAFRSIEAGAVMRRAGAGHATHSRDAPQGDAHETKPAVNSQHADGACHGFTAHRLRDRRDWSSGGHRGGRADRTGPPGKADRGASPAAGGCRLPTIRRAAQGGRSGFTLRPHCASRLRSRNAQCVSVNDVSCSCHANFWLPAACRLARFSSPTYPVWLGCSSSRPVSLNGRAFSRQLGDASHL